MSGFGFQVWGVRFQVSVAAGLHHCAFTGVIMSSQSHHHSKDRRAASRESFMWKPHKDWRVWVVVILMLAAIVGYVLTLDNSILPH